MLKQDETQFCHIHRFDVGVARNANEFIECEFHKFDLSMVLAKAMLKIDGGESIFEIRDTKIAERAS